MPKGKRKHHTQSTPNTVKISINKAAPEAYVAPIRVYLITHYGGFSKLDQFYYDDGGICLIVEMKDIHMAVKAAKDNPHSVRGLKFYVKHEGAQSVGTSSARNSNAQYAESECDRILATIPQLQSLPDIEGQMRYVYRVLALSDEDHEKRQEFIQRLEDKCCATLNYQCYLYAFGSSVNKLGMKNCDLDLVLLTNGPIHEAWQGELPEAKMLLTTIKGMMYREQYHFGISKIVPIPHARIPVIKFRHEPTLIDCDISFNRRAGVLNTRLLRHVMEFSETARLLSFTIRLWGKQKNFVGGGGQKINSYTITLMIIFYLQQRQILPPLIKIKNHNNTIHDSHTDDECFVTELSDFDGFQSTTQQSLANLLKGFIEYYIRFSFESQIISVLHGVPIPCDNSLFNTQLINVQDPFEVNYNSAKGVQANMVWWFKRCLCEAWQFPSLLQSTEDLPSWGLQYLFHYEDLPKKNARRRTPLYVPRSNETLILSPACSADASPEPEQTMTDTRKSLPYTCTISSNTDAIIQTGGGKVFTVEVTLPSTAELLSSLDMYTQACGAVCTVLTSMFGMEVMAPHTDHPVSRWLYSQLPTRKRSHSPTAATSVKIKQDSTSSEHEEPDITEIPFIKKRKTDKLNPDADRVVHLAKKNKENVVEIIDLTDADEEIKAERDTAIWEAGIPIGYFLPYIIQAKSKHHVFRDTKQLNFLTFNYDKCVQDIDSALKKEQNLKSGLEKVNFTTTFQPKDGSFQSIHIEFNDVYTQQFDALCTFMARLIPVAIQRRFDT